MEPIQLVSQATCCTKGCQDLKSIMPSTNPFSAKSYFNQVTLVNNNDLLTCDTLI